MKTLLTLACLFIGAQSASAATATPKNVRDTVDASCSHEQEIAHCGNDVVGEFLFNCIDTYKKAHADTFKISSGCKLAIEKFHAQKKANK